MKNIEKIQSYGKRIAFPHSSPVIEAVPAGTLHVSDTLVFFDAFWPLEDQLLDHAPRLRLGEAALDVVLSAVESAYRGPTSPPRRLVAGVTLVVEDVAPEVWKPLSDGEGNPSLVPVDNGSIVLFDLAEVDSLRVERGRLDGREFYGRVRLGPMERIGDALAISCGAGDGVYEIWLGYGPSGQLVQIVIDLELFEDDEELFDERIE